MRRFFFLVLIFTLLYACASRRILHTRRAKLSNRLSMIFGNYQILVPDSQIQPPVIARTAKSVGLMVENTGNLNLHSNGKFKVEVIDPYATPFRAPMSADHKYWDVNDVPPEQLLCPAAFDQSYTTQDHNSLKLYKAVNGFCSVWLVAPDKIVTAGHCVKPFNCEDMAMVFDFRPTANSLVVEDTKTYHLASPDHVYFCKQVIGWELSDTLGDVFKSQTTKNNFNNKRWKRIRKAIHRAVKKDPYMDWAVIQLDRDVYYDGYDYVEVQNPNEEYYTPALAEEPQKEVVTIGHPNGFSELYDSEGKISVMYKHDDEYTNFLAAIDGEKGSSGSVVADKSTGKAIGILVAALGIWKSEDNPTDPTTKCWQREEIGSCINKHCDYQGIVISANKQFYKYIENIPTKLPVLSKQTNPSGVRVTALQKLLGYSITDGQWTDAFSTFISTKAKDKDYGSCLIGGVHTACGKAASATGFLPATYNGETVPPSLLSLFLCEYGTARTKYETSLQNMMEDGLATSAQPRTRQNAYLMDQIKWEEPSTSLCPYFENNILSIRELLRNGHEHFDRDYTPPAPEPSNPRQYNPFDTPTPMIQQPTDINVPLEGSHLTALNRALTHFTTLKEITSSQFGPSGCNTQIYRHLWNTEKAQ